MVYKGTYLYSNFEFQRLIQAIQRLIQARVCVQGGEAPGDKINTAAAALRTNPGPAAQVPSLKRKQPPSLLPNTPSASHTASKGARLSASQSHIPSHAAAPAISRSTISRSINRTPQSSLRSSLRSGNAGRDAVLGCKAGHGQVEQGQGPRSSLRSMRSGTPGVTPGPERDAPFLGTGLDGVRLKTGQVEQGQMGHGEDASDKWGSQGEAQACGGVCHEAGAAEGGVKEGGVEGEDQLLEGLRDVSDTDLLLDTESADRTRLASFREGVAVVKAEARHVEAITDALTYCIVEVRGTN